MSDNIQTQGDLEELLNSPERFRDYVTNRSKEVLGETVKEQMETALASHSRWRNHARQRIRRWMAG